MNGATDLPEQHVCRSIAGVAAKDQEETVTKTIREHIHLVGPNSDTGADVVLAANHIQSIRNGVDVGAALER